jgi:hypothetical protein
VLYRLSADLIVIVHALFVVFVVLGGLMVLRWPRLAWFHLPAAGWGALIEFGGWICPLTPLEKWLRVQGGLAPYQGGFIAHYLLPILYPAGLTRDTQVVLGLVVLAINLAVYGYLLHRWSTRRREAGS